MRSALTCFIVFLLNPFVATGLAAKGCEKPDDQLRATAHSVDRTEVKFALGSWKISVPRNYLRYDPKPCGGRAEALALRVMLPDFSGASPENIAGLRIGGPMKDRVDILVEDARLSSLDGILRSYERLRDQNIKKRTLSVTQMQGFEAFVFNDTLHDRVVYYDKTAGFVSKLFVCTTWDGGGLCNERFVAGGLRIKIAFDWNHLSAWQAIRASTMSLLNQIGIGS